MTGTRSGALFAPEVVQTASLDCGPASLKCLQEIFGIHASYGRLRLARQDCSPASLKLRPRQDRQTGGPQP